MKLSLTMKFTLKHLHFRYHEGPSQSMSHYQSDSSNLLFLGSSHNRCQSHDRLGCIALHRIQDATINLIKYSFLRKLS